MLNLAALGAGLGQFAQDYRQQQESALRQMQARMTLDQLQRSLRDRALAGQALSAGGLPGFDGGGGMLPQGMPQMQAPQQIPSPMGMPPQPQQAPQMALPPLDSNAGTPRGRMPLEDDPETQAYTQQQAAAEGLPVLSYDVEREQAPTASSTTDEGGVTTNTSDTPLGGGAQSAAAPAASASGASAGGAGVSLQELPAWMSMFRHIDPVAVAQRIKQVRPDAPDDAILGATEVLMKMGQGTLREQATFAGLMKALIGDDTRRQIATGSVGGVPTVASRRADTAATQGAERLDQGNRRIEQGERRIEQGDRRIKGVQDRFDQRRLDKVALEAQKRGDTQSAAALMNMGKRFNQLRSAISVLDNQASMTPEDKTKREQMKREMDDLGARIEKRMNALDKAAPVPGQQ